MIALDCPLQKDIPAEFYWDDTWKVLEQTEFCVELAPYGVSSGANAAQSLQYVLGVHRSDVLNDL